LKDFAHSVLTKLKQEYPLPVEIYMTCYNKATLTARGQCTAYAYVDRRTHVAFIHTALKQPMARILNTVAHEYYHCIQKYILDQPDKHPELESEANKFASEYTLKYLKEYNRSLKCDM